MPALSTIPLQPPPDADEFEKILIPYAQATYQGQASQYGRKGQKQDGIDIIVDRHNGSRFLIQCKDYLKTDVTDKKIDKWIKKAEDEVKFDFEKLIIALGCERDGLLQKYVCMLSDERKADGKFLVSIIFWDDIQQFVKLDEDLLRNYYPNIFYSNERVEEKYKEVNSTDTESQKRPEPIKTEAEIRSQCLDLIVKYRIKEYLDADQYAGFPFELVTEGDLFEIELQDLLNRSIRYKASDRYYEVSEFLGAFSQFTYYMATICTSNGAYARYTIPMYEGAGVEIEKQKRKIEKLREKAKMKLDEIEDS